MFYILRKYIYLYCVNIYFAFVYICIYVKSHCALYSMALDGKPKVISITPPYVICNFFFLFALKASLVFSGLIRKCMSRIFF